jgi:hypothetical protein
LGGNKMKNWVESQLGSLRNPIQRSKKAKSNFAGFKNEFRKSQYISLGLKVIRQIALLYSEAVLPKLLQMLFNSSTSTTINNNNTNNLESFIC